MFCNAKEIVPAIVFTPSSFYFISVLFSAGETSEVYTVVKVLKKQRSIQTDRQTNCYQSTIV